MDQILYEHHPAPGKLEVIGVYEWPLWKGEVSTFDWTYDRQEECYILSGRFIVTPEEGEPLELGEGDLITFPKGMSCQWQILEPVEKHYRFND